MLERKVEDRIGYRSNGVWDYDSIRQHSFFTKLEWEKLEARKLQPPKIKLYSKSMENIFDL
jgi:hypothetical protein